MCNATRYTHAHTPIVDEDDYYSYDDDDDIVNALFTRTPLQMHWMVTFYTIILLNLCVCVCTEWWSHSHVQCTHFGFELELRRLLSERRMATSHEPHTCALMFIYHPYDKSTFAIWVSNCSAIGEREASQTVVNIIFVSVYENNNWQIIIMAKESEERTREMRCPKNAKKERKTGKRNQTTIENVIFKTSRVGFLNVLGEPHACMHESNETHSIHVRERHFARDEIERKII